MDNSTISALSRALDFGSARIGAISGNLSNVNTPGYKRKDASFASLLEGQDGGDSPFLAPRRTNFRHLSLDAGDLQTGDSVRADGNNVDIDAEGARLAQAELFYNGAAQLIAGQFSGLKYAIAGGR